MASRLLVSFRCLFLLAVVSTACVILITIGNEILYSAKREPILITVDPTDTSFTIRTEGCTIPGLQPFDPSVITFMKEPSVERCPVANISLLSSNRSHIWINWNQLEHYKIKHNLTHAANISCCYKPFFRPILLNDRNMSEVINRVQYEKCSTFANYIKVTDEFVRVICSAQDYPIHQQFFLFAIKKPLESYYALASGQNETSAYNVIVMGIDGVSRLNFRRTMAKTSAYLKSKGAIEMMGYNKVGDNTFPNVIPMLSGIPNTDIEKRCRLYQRTFDSCPFLWKRFKEQGFYTAFAEDSTSLGIFTYEKGGFIESPTDYYPHTFVREAEKNVGQIFYYTSYHCMGDKYFFAVILDYIDSLTTTLQHSKLFGFFWEVSMSHDFLNYPRVMDERYTALIKKLERNGYLNETILIFLSDHGIRWGEIRKTKQGRLEERLPLMLVLTPPTFQKRYPLALNNLNINSQRLITPFDIHETLLDLTNLNSITDAEIEIRTNMYYAQSRGISLFLPVPLNRTCAVAGIDDHWCTCHSGVQLSMNSIEVEEAAANLIIKLNELLVGQAECAKLILDEVISVTEMAVGKTEEGEAGWREFLVQLRTSPGGALFEGTLRNHTTAGLAMWALSGSISRLNLYGQQSHCVPDYRLKLYCYCLEQVGFTDGIM